MRMLLLRLLLVSLGADAFYISYENVPDYEEGERIPILANKLISSDSLTSVDYKYLSLCGAAANAVTKNSGSVWQQAMNAIHGDAIRRETSLDIRMLQDVSCQQLCIMDTSSDYETAIDWNLHYQWIVDDMPVAYRYETDDKVAVRYWGGVPVGHVGNVADDSRFENVTSNQRFINNHLNFEIMYWKSPSTGKYRIARTIVQPFSIQYDFYDDLEEGYALPRNISTALASCQEQEKHTYYDLLRSIPPQKASTGEKVLFTYDVLWTQWNGKDPSSKRWNVFLRMDDAVPMTVQVFGLLVAVLVNILLVACLVVWLMRDLSYKPLLMDIEDDVSPEQAAEVQLWPLSSHVFCLPRKASIVLCVACGIGAHLFLATFWFVLFSRLGVVNESLGASIITPAVLLYILMSPFGGYVTARLYAIFHGSRVVALQACFVTAGLYPIIGIIVFHLCYDVIPDKLTPDYNVISNSVPVIMMWLFLGFPLTLLGGWFGYRQGEISNFPVTTAKGYQALALPDSGDAEYPQRHKAWRYGRYVLLFLVGGVFPVACSFVEYAYNVAGPVYVGYYTDSSIFAVLSFLLFLSAVALVAVLLFYKQIRQQQYGWWWASFTTGASSGFWIFILSISWILYDAHHGSLVNGAAASYTLWFAYTSFGVMFVGGFVSVAACMLFSRILYSYLMKRAQPDMPFENESDTASLRNSQRMTSTASTSADEAKEAEEFQSDLELSDESALVSFSVSEFEDSDMDEI